MDLADQIAVMSHGKVEQVGGRGSSTTIPRTSS